RVWTIDLPDEAADATAFRLNDIDYDLVRKAAHGRGTAGWYAAQSAERDQIIQILSDSATYDFADVECPLDFAYIDGAHSYEYAVVDSVNALLRLRPGGVIIWDDYYHFFPGVVRALGELNRIVNVYRLAGTGLGATILPDDWPTSRQREALE